LFKKKLQEENIRSEAALDAWAAKKSLAIADKFGVISFIFFYQFKRMKSELVLVVISACFKYI
jgi:hypothetical protein